MFTTGETVGLAEWIIDDTCLVQLQSTLHIVNTICLPYGDVHYIEYSL